MAGWKPAPRAQPRASAAPRAFCWRLPAAGVPPVSMNSLPVYVGLDVGGSSMKAGVVDDDGRLLSAVSVPTEAHRGQGFGLGRMCEAIRRAVAEAGLTLDRITAIGVATPGLMDIPA